MTGVVASTSTKSSASTKSTKSPSKSLLGSFFQLFSFSSKKTPANVDTNECEADDDHTQDSASSSSDEENDKSQGDKSSTPPKPSSNDPSSTDVPQPISAFSPVKDSKEQHQQSGSSSKSLSTSNHRDKSSSSPRLNTLTNDSTRRPNSVTRDTCHSGSSKRFSPRSVNGSSTSRSNHGTRGEESKERENENNTSSIRLSRSFNTLGEAHARHAASNKQRQYKPCAGEEEILAESTLYPSYGSSKRLSPPSVYSSANSDADGSSSSHRSRSRSSSRSHIDDERNNGSKSSGGRSRSGSRSHHHHSNSNSNHGGFDGMIGNFQIFPSENNRRSHSSSTGSSKGRNHGNNREEQGSCSARSSSRSHHHHESSGSLSAASSRSRSNSHSLSPRLIPNNTPIRVPSIGSSLHALAAQEQS